MTGPAFDSLSPGELLSAMEEAAAMAHQTEFEIPQTLRDLAEKSVDQARDAYQQFLDTSRQAQSTMARSSEAVGASAKEIQKRAMEYAETNTRAGFDHAERLTRARNVQEALELQVDFAREQMESYSRQAQELSRLMAKSGTPR